MIPNFICYSVFDFNFLNYNQFFYVSDKNMNVLIKRNREGYVRSFGVQKNEVNKKIKKYLSEIKKTVLLHRFQKERYKDCPMV